MRKPEHALFGICRGIQEINVAHGGNIFYRVHEVAGKIDHRMPQNDDASVEDIFKPRHIINIRKNSILESFIGQKNVLLTLFMARALINWVKV